MSARLTIVLILLTGCSSPPQPDFASPNATSRALAIQQAVRTDDNASIPQLIGLLNSDDPLVRMMAQRALEDLTGRSFGYHYAAPPWERDDGIDRWLAWYAESEGDA